MGTSAPRNWRLTVPKATKVMLVRPLMANWTWLLEMTVLFLHVRSAPPTKSVYESSYPLLFGVDGGISLWTDVCHPLPPPPPPQLPASEIKQNFLSINLACLLAFEWSAARPPCIPFRNRASAVVVPPPPPPSFQPHPLEPIQRKVIFRKENDINIYIKHSSFYSSVITLNKNLVFTGHTQLQIKAPPSIQIKAGEIPLRKKASGGTSLVVQWLRLCAPNAGGLGSIPGWGTRPCMPQLKDPVWHKEDRWSRVPQLRLVAAEEINKNKY